VGRKVGWAMGSSVTIVEQGEAAPEAMHWLHESKAMEYTLSSQFPLLSSKPSGIIWMRVNFDRSA